MCELAACARRRLLVRRRLVMCLLVLVERF